MKSNNYTCTFYSQVCTFNLKNTQLNNFEFNYFVYFYEDFVNPHFTSFICRHWSRFCHFSHCKLGASWSGFPVPLLAVIASFWHTPDLGRNRIPFLPSIAEYSTSAVCSLQYCWSNLGNKRWRKNFINVNTTNQKMTISKSISIFKAKISKVCCTSNVLLIHNTFI